MRLRNIVLTVLALGCGLFANSTETYAAAKVRRKILIAVDGFSYDAFLEAQRQGLLTQFTQKSVHVAPFPTMTDISWATMTDTVALFGDQGRIKNVEATYFDEATQSVQGDPRDYYQRLAFPKYYLGAFQAVFNPYLEALVYFPTEEVPKMEIKSVIDQILASNAATVTGYIGSVDSTAHTQLNRLYPVVRVLDAEIKRLESTLKSRGEDPEIFLVSDHGNRGRFTEGQPENELLPVEISKSIEKAGLRMVPQLKQKNDVTMPLLALGTWGPVYLKDRKNLNPLLQSFRTEPWFDLAMYVNRNNSRQTIMTVVSSLGDARLELVKETQTYRYYPGHGNPLQIHAAYHSADGKPVDIPLTKTMELSAASDYPDALYRLLESASNRNFDFPDLIVTLKDGYYIQNALGGFTKMYRTHGALSRASSSGLLASNGKSLPAQVRTREIFPLLGFDSRDLFGEVYRAHVATGKDALMGAARSRNNGIETHARDFSDTRVFRHLSRFISDTRPYFLISEMADFQKAFKSNPIADPSGQGLSPMNFDISKFEMGKVLSPEDLGGLTDAILTAGTPEKIMEDPRVVELKEKIEQATNWKIGTTAPSAAGGGTGFLDSISEFLLPGKRGVMKLYQIPYLLQNSLVIQEKTRLEETRDLKFAALWVRDRDSIVWSEHDLNSKYKVLSVPTIQMLFSEVRREAELEDRLYPTPLSKVYDSRLGPVTIVYVPGIYNAIFDKEIFSLGLQSLKDDLGLRVLQPPVESTCSSEYNAKIIRDYLVEDVRTRAARSLPRPRYLFLSYSKGAVDTLHYFLSMPNFVSDSVIGMVSIAAPLQGSSILDKSDLPFEVVSALAGSKGPEVCRNEQTAAKSITPAAMSSFWRKNSRALMGLTRYYSVSFASTPEDSHLFMRATKLIAQFDEDNDGVVPVSASKFPAALRALDFGVIEADHLAGILSSRFNQKAFLRSLVTTVKELRGDDWNLNFKWNSSIILDEYNKERNFWNKQGLKGLVYGNSFDLNRQLLPYVPDPADNYVPEIKLPTSGFRFDPYATLDVQKMPNVLEAVRVNPALPSNLAKGINIEFHHRNMVHFRMDHQFNYESRSPLGLDDNQNFGFAPAAFDGEEGWMRMRSQNNSMRMTTMAYRFRPGDFPKMSLKLAVTEEVPGADPVIGRTGKDDSAFQVWFSIRIGHANGDRATINAKADRVVLFGYYWGSKVDGEVRQPGQIFENWYSNKNIVVATLPEAKQLLLNSPEMLKVPQLYERNFREDLQRAFPNDDVDQMDVISVTFQHDSNDTGTSSDAYFKFLRFTP